MKFKLIISFILLHVLTSGQIQTDYLWPIKAPLPLTGNYAEIRPNHFHMGLDISTQNKENYRVQAIADGWVSRIRISSIGYGKSIYITHPDGHLSLYAHLNKFEEPIASFVKQLMYDQKLNEFDISLNENQLPITKGQIIALSGNTGGSSGPHLHFEIRDTKSEIPLNPLLFYNGFDKVKPILMGVLFYDLSDSLRVNPFANKIIKPQGQLRDTVIMPAIELPVSIVGFAFDAYDRLEINGNKNQVAKAELHLDTTLVYSHYFANLQFDDARYVNEFSDKKAGQKFQKCFLPEQYPKGMYPYVFNRGRLLLKDTLWHTYSLLLSDESGNTCSVKGKIRSKKVSMYSSSTCGTNFFTSGMDHSTSAGRFSISIPAKALYNSVCLSARSQGQNLSILPSDVNLQTAFQVGIQDSGAMKLKWVLVNGASVQAGRAIKDSVFFDCKSFGSWKLQRDTLPPSLQALFLKGKHTKNAKQLKFLISDKKSGISGYDIYINDAWHHAYYDAKSSQLILDLDMEVQKGLLKIKVRVKDKCENTAEYNFNYRYL